MKNVYFTPEIEIICFKTPDVVRASVTVVPTQPVTTAGSMGEDIVGDGYGDGTGNGGFVW
ncbi:MAG: hypothetical protein IJC86_01910 [Clostridia bacterium]|nr:hypothetical protein [Clostridia bacterium]